LRGEEVPAKHVLAEGTGAKTKKKGFGLWALGSGRRF